MIDIERETLISLQAATELPFLQRKGRPPSFVTLVNWSKRGVRGIRLEVLRLGGTTMTSREAVKRFIAKLTRAHAKRMGAVHA